MCVCVRLRLRLRLRTCVRARAQGYNSFDERYLNVSKGAPGTISKVCLFRRLYLSVCVFRCLIAPMCVCVCVCVSQVLQNNESCKVIWDRDPDAKEVLQPAFPALALPFSLSLARAHLW